MFKRSIRWLMLVLLCSNNLCLASNKKIDPYSVLNQLYQDAGGGALSLKKEEYYARFFLKLAMQCYNDGESVDAWLLGEFRDVLLKNIRSQFPFITDDEYEEQRSIGVLLVEKKGFNQALDILMRETRLLCIHANVVLVNSYMHMVEDGLRPKPCIVALFKELAEEGCHNNQLFYGKIALYGIGVTKNIPEGLHYLDLAAQAGHTRACKELVFYYEQIEDIPNTKKYLELGAAHEMPEIMHRLALFLVRRDYYDRALTLCTRALELDAECYGATFVLGLIYAWGLGVDQDAQRGFLLFQEVAENADEENNATTKALACLNLGLLYELGMVGEKSQDKAEECYQEARELGFEWPAS